jgi:enamine deaminase RidA (YjgF/YER057c/UK114 family)
MHRKTVFPQDHWSLRVDIPYSMGLACGDLIFLCGQADLEGDGRVCNAGDLLQQSQNAIDHIANLFNELDASLEDLVKLVVFYVPDPALGEAEYIAALAAMLKTQHRPVITLVPVPRMFYPGLVVEIDAHGMHGDALQRRDVTAGNGFSQLVRAGEMIFGGGITATDASGRVISPGDVIAQSRIVLETLASRLADVGAGVGDLVKINNWYVAGGSADDWAESARVRADFYPEPGPCATGIPLHDLNQPGALIRTDFWAMLDRDGNSIDKRHCWPEGHWDWPILLPFKHGLRCRNLVFVGGQVSMDADANIIDPGEMETQTRTSMDNIGKVLAGFGLDHSAIVKLNTFYQGSVGDDDSGDADDLHGNVTIRGSYFNKPGPASTGIPFRCLAYEGMMIEIEAIAISDAD